MASRRKLHITGIIVGGILATGPIWGCLGTILGMMRAFAVLNQQGVKDPAALSHSIKGVLMIQVIGMAACPFGLLLFVYSIIQLTKQKRIEPPPLPPLAGKGSV